MHEQAKRGRGRPRTGTSRIHIDITLAPFTVDFLEWVLGPQGNRSAFIEELIKAHPQYEGWAERKALSERLSQ